MIDHIVLLKPKSGVSDSALAALWVGIQGLQTQIPGIQAIHVGSNTSPEDLDRGFTLGFTVRFNDAAARDAYLPHPEHLAVVPLVLAVADEVLVFDLDIG